MKDKYYERLKRLAKEPNSSLLMYGYEASAILKEIERLNKRIEDTIKYCEESNITLKSHYFMDVIKLLKGEKI